MKKIILLGCLTICLWACNDNKKKENRSAEQNAIDYRLNDIWALESINGSPIEKTGKRPTLEFHLKENKVYGFGGCNRINGAISLEKDSIAIGALAATRMACPNDTLENTFLPKISNKSFAFQYENLILTLTSKDDVLTFRKVD